jgi:CheY-like chemotaxis protein
VETVFRRVLVVDDGQALRELLSIALADEGYQIRAAAGGREALILAEVWRPHLVMLDLRMAGMDGWTFLTHYRRDGGAGVPVLVVTAALQALAEAAALQVPIILKPFDLERLLEQVRRLTESHPG